MKILKGNQKEQSQQDKECSKLDRLFLQLPNAKGNHSKVHGIG
jgi:hypothetical protein